MSEPFMGAAGGKKLASGTFLGSSATITGLGFQPTWVMIYPSQVDYNQRVISMHYDVNNGGTPFMGQYRNNGNYVNVTSNNNYLVPTADGFVMSPMGSNDTLTNRFYYFAGRDD